MINDREDWTEMEYEKADIKKRMQYILNMRPVFNKEALFSDGTEYYRTDQIQRFAGKTGRKCVDSVLLHKSAEYAPRQLLTVAGQ